MRFIKTLFDKKNKSSYEQSKRLSWSDIIDECYDKQLDFTDAFVSKVIYTDNKEKRAVILLMPNGCYSVVFEILYPYDDDELQYIATTDLHGFWSQYDCTSSFFDTEERAVASVFSEPPFKYNAM